MQRQIDILTDIIAYGRTLYQVSDTNFGQGTKYDSRFIYHYRKVEEALETSQKTNEHRKLLKRFSLLRKEYTFNFNLID